MPRKIWTLESDDRRRLNEFLNNLRYRITYIIQLTIFWNCLIFRSTDRYLRYRCLCKLKLMLFVLSIFKWIDLRFFFIAATYTQILVFFSCHWSRTDFDYSRWAWIFPPSKNPRIPTYSKYMPTPIFAKRSASSFISSPLWPLICLNCTCM